MASPACRRRTPFRFSFLGVEEWILNTGNNTITVDKSQAGTAAVTFVGNGGRDTLKFTNWTSDLVFGLEDLVGGTNVTAIGFTDFEGGNGNDVFHGSDADETMDGGGGTNTFHGSLGGDVLKSSGSMIVDYSTSASSVHLLYKQVSGLYKVRRHWRRTESVQGRLDQCQRRLHLIGSIHTDTLSISANVGSIQSNGGDDTLIGGSGNDTHRRGWLRGDHSPGNGNDVVEFGTGGGTLDLSTTGSAATIDLRAGTFSYADGSFDIVTGEFDKLIGTASNDVIHGTDGADDIDGHAGTDIIHGHGGDDRITIKFGTVNGGAGDDTIEVTNQGTVHGGDGNDVIRTRRA